MAPPRDTAPSRRRRLTFALLLALALAPGTLLRTQVPEQRVNILSVSPVADLPDAGEANGFRREGVWELDSPNIDFGGYSALLVLANRGLLRTFSDRGVMMTFAMPETAQAGHVSFAGMRERGHLSRFNPDIESATRDDASGTYWIGYEGRHAVIRYRADGTREAMREPPEWTGWPHNAGAEAMARLPDGRFLVLPEGNGGGLLYPGDPTLDASAIRFGLTLPQDFDVTDIAALPDGRVLVLLRRLSRAYPPFSAALAIADPAGLTEGGELVAEQVLDLDSLLPRENYEGLAVAPQEDGSLTVWIIADDNLASFQRTLLAKLAWTPPAAASTHEKARED
jgi:hypothetical protein